jgi:signal transduction histidine kinase
MTEFPPGAADFSRRLLALERAAAERIARRLHNEIGQTLTAMRIEYVSDARFSDPKLAARQARVDRLLDQAIRELRAVMVELRPPALEAGGLIDALDGELRLRREAARDTGLELEFDENLARRRWDPDVEYAAFMIAREAIANALQHAGAGQVQVRVEGDDGLLRLEITDDGRGLPADLAREGGGTGLAGMQGRSRAIDALLDVRSAPGQGTTVSLTWRRPT